MYDGRSPAVNWRRASANENAGRSPRFVSARSESAVRLNRSVDDLDLVAYAPAGLRRLGEQALGAVFVTHDGVVFHGLLHIFLDLVSGKTAAEGAKDGRHFLAAATADLVSENATEHRTADCSGAGSLTRLFNLLHALYHAAFVADRGHHRRRWRRRDGGCRRALVRRLGSRDVSRLRVLGGRLVLGRLRRFGLRRGLFGCLRDSRISAVLIPHRSRDPAENGPD